jgi:hypothetical protein
MADSFINKLSESSTINNTDYTVFDVGDASKGTYNTKKIKLETLSNKISSDVIAGVNNTIKTLQNSVNTLNQSVQNKLDKGGLDFYTTEKMAGPLYLNKTLTVSGTSEFYANVDMHSYKITNLSDPTNDKDAVNKQYIDNLSNVYVPLSGGVANAMTGYLTLYNDPTSVKHAATKGYVDKFVPLSGGTSSQMTGHLYLFGDVTGLGNNVAANKKYVDDQIITKLTNAASTNNTTYLKKTTDSMQNGSTLTLGGNPTLSGHATNKNYVDTTLSAVSSVLAKKTYVDTGFLHISGGDTMTGKLVLSEDPTLTSNVKQAATKNYVDLVEAKLANYIPLSGGIMTFGYITAPYDNPAIDRNLVTKKYVDTLVSNNTGGFVKQDFLKSNYLPLSGGSLSGRLTVQSHSEKYSTGGSSGNVSLSIKTANIFTIDITGNITEFTFTDEPLESYTVSLFITQKGLNINPFNVTSWKINGTTVKWSAGKIPEITKIQNKTDVFCLTKIGTTWYGFIGGQNY